VGEWGQLYAVADDTACATCHNLAVLRDRERFCDGCGQKLPAGSKLGQQVVSKEEARGLSAAGSENADGTVTIDFCLDCRVKRANRIKYGY